MAGKPGTLRRPPRRRPTRVVRGTAASALVVGIAAAYVAGWGAPALWATPVVAVLVGLSELAVVHLTFGRQRWTFSLTEAVVGASMVLAPGAWIGVSMALGVVIAQVARHQPRLKTEYNVAQYTAATLVGAAVAGVCSPPLTPLVAGCLAMAAYWMVNHTLVAIAVASTSRRPVGSLLFGSAAISGLHSAGNTSVGVLAAWLAIRAPAGLLGLLVPMALLWSSFDQQTRRAAEARLFAELARGQERASGRSIDISAQVVLTSAARLFGGADVEMLLLSADGPVRYAGDEFGVPIRDAVDNNAFDEPWVITALGRRGVSTGVERERPWCAAMLGRRERPLAVLVARRPAGSAPFGRRDVMLAEVLVTQAESWLSVADLTEARDAAVDRATAADDAARALGDLGAHTAPALGMLRESAARLVRLTEARDRADDVVSDIVSELHTVERAVASLLGAIALAAEPDLSDVDQDDDHLAPGAVATEWTTSGVMA